MNVSGIISAEIKSNRIQSLELAELELFKRLKKLDLENNIIKNIINPQRHGSFKCFREKYKPARFEINIIL